MVVRGFKGVGVVNDGEVQVVEFWVEVLGGWRQG